LKENGLIRIGNAGGYWGDDPHALRRQVLGPLDLDYISIDYLAEVTMSILQKQKGRDPSAGYARDFVTQIEPLLEQVLLRRIRIITNAGGVNPEACAAALAAVARAKGLKLRIAVVEGDDVAPRLAELMAEGVDLRNLETGAPFQHANQALAANAYFGAMPVAEALSFDPHIVISGRVTDTGITLAPLIHEFGWGPADWNLLAAGIVAGHIIECGAQATGGNFTDWKKVPSFNDLGFPIVECGRDGGFTVTKHPGSGGLVTCQTVREQLLYEMGEPRTYLTPDVVADFSSVRLEPDGPDRVRVSGIQGRPPTELLKVSIAYADGFKSGGALIISGPDARAKADLLAQVFWQRLEAELDLAGIPRLEQTCTECVGDDATHRRLSPRHPASEILLRLSARSARRDGLELFRKLLPSMILSGPAGVAVTGGAPAISEVVSYWPALMPRTLALPSVRLLEERGTGRLEQVHATGPLPWPATPGPQPVAEPDDPWPTFPADGPMARLPLMRIAHARSGDKGDTANIGLIGRSGPCYAWLRDHLDAGQVKRWFSGHCLGPVTRHPVPRLWALNFLLEETLGGGGTMSLFIDAQGKTLAQALLRCEVELPEALLATIGAADLPCPGELVAEGSPA
jgi:Acyclic terpene utilisation family protein AtuA